MNSSAYNNGTFIYFYFHSIAPSENQRFFISSDNDYVVLSTAISALANESLQV